ncbi:AfsR/SARP family transcriptional regulator [Streptomyces daliensis]
MLGPTEVRGADGEPLPLSAPMLRGLLAALVLRPCRVVPVEDLAHQLWGEQPPASVRTTLRNYVMRLRKVVADERIRTVAGGYQLFAEREETDLGRFQELLLRSRELAAGDPERAVALLDEALALWRGSPLGGIGDCPLLTVHRPRLEELRLTACEERFALRLLLGQHTTVIDELLATSRQHPMRERLTGQLMLALHRAGRSAEALAAFRAARDTLVGELAIEPGAELRELEAAILRGDPALMEWRTGSEPGERGQGAPGPGPPGGDTDTAPDHPDVRAPGPGTPPAPAPPSPAATEPPPPPPPPLPPRAAFPAGIPTFVARGVELARVREWLTGAVDAPALCLLDGPGGVGKSSLAVRAAREVADRFPDGLLHVDLRGADPHRAPLETEEALRRLLAALGVPRDAAPHDEETALALYRERLEGKRVLVLLDNVFSTAQIAALLPAQPESACLVTSRTVLLGLPGAHHLHLDVLDTQDATALVRSVSGRAPEAGEEGDWEELVCLCGRLPLALHLIATRMASRPCWSAGDWASTLRDERARLDQLVVADRDVRASLLVSIDQLAGSGAPDDERAAALFPLLGAAAVTRHSAESAARLAGWEPGDARLALERLTDAQIALSPQPGAYALHDLVRAVATREAALLPPEETRAALGRLSCWYLGSLHRVNGPLRLDENFARRYRQGARHFPGGLSFDGTEQALAWADGAVDEVLSLADQLSGAEYDTGAYEEEEEGGDPRGARRAGEDAPLDGGQPGPPGPSSPLSPLRPLSDFALEAARALESYFAIRLSWRAQRRLCETALRVAGRRGDRRAEAVALAQLGKVEGQRGEGAAGARLLRRAISLFLSHGMHEEAVGAMSNLVPCLASAGRLDEAVEVGNEALREVETHGPEGVAYSLRNNLGRCHLHLGDYEQARHLLVRNYEAADLAQYQIATAGSLAEYHLRLGEFEEAARWADRGLGHAAEQPFDPFAVAEQHALLARALDGLGRAEQARTAEDRALALLDDLNTREAARLKLRLRRDGDTAAQT